MLKRIILSLAIMLATVNLYAISELGLCINTGLTSDPNNISDLVSSYNSVMRDYHAENANTEFTPIYMPYSFLLGGSVRYQWNYILFRLGGSYTSNFVFGHEGAIQPSGGSKNTIKITSWQLAFPATAAFVLPLYDKVHFYFGGGLSFYISKIEIRQSSPDNIPNLPSSEAKENYYTFFGGFNLMFGIEIPVSDTYTITAEWVHQFGVSPEVHDAESTKEMKIDVSTNYFLIGVTYYFKM